MVCGAPCSAVSLSRPNRLKICNRTVSGRSASATARPASALARCLKDDVRRRFAEVVRSPGVRSAACFMPYCTVPVLRIQ